ncbi:hypothetical protein HDU77_004381 [Chytriomyces hyalinus]|nr:hypothetical protein HDU77_004381 [Chytriomyces hyalinus]
MSALELGLQQVATGMKMPVDVLKGAFMLTSAYFLAMLYYFIPSRASNVRHMFSIIASCTLYLSLFSLDGFLELVAMCAIVYAATYNFRSNRWMPVLTFYYVLGHFCVRLFIVQILTTSAKKFDATTPMMVLVIKLTSFAWNVYDGTKRDEEISPELRSKTIRKFPEVLEFFGFVFFFAAFLVGPAFDFNDYREFTNCTGVFAVEAGKGKTKKLPSRLIPTLRCLFGGIFWMGVFIKFSKEYSYERLVDGSTASWPAWQRFLFMQACGVAARSKFYSAWLMSEGACNFVGIGYNGMKDKTPEWTRAKNVSIVGFEFAPNFKGMLDAWNMRTGFWLRNCVYLRMVKPGQKPGFLVTFTTFLTSALWHGFHLGYYLTFVVGAFTSIVARSLRRNFRPVFMKPSKYAYLKPAYDIAGWAMTWTGINFIAAPFTLWALDKSINCWASVGFYAIYGVAWLFVWMEFLGGSKALKGLAAGTDEGDKKVAKEVAGAKRADDNAELRKHFRAQIPNHLISSLRDGGLSALLTSGKARFQIANTVNATLIYNAAICLLHSPKLYLTAYLNLDSPELLNNAQAISQLLRVKSSTVAPGVLLGPLYMGLEERRLMRSQCLDVVTTLKDSEHVLSGSEAPGRNSQEEDVEMSLLLGLGADGVFGLTNESRKMQVDVEVAVIGMNFMSIGEEKRQELDMETRKEPWVTVKNQEENMASLNSKPPHANSNKSALDDISYTDELEMESTDSDEGFDSDFADAHPLYSRASGLQFMGLAASPEVPASPTKNIGRGKESVRRVSRPSEARGSLTAAKEKSVGSTEPREHVNAGMEPGSQRNKDSVLHYFVATQDSELSLDLYLSRIISSFLDSPLPVFAGSNENPIVTQSRFSRHQVPRSNDDGTTLEEYLNAIKTNVIDRATRVASPKQIGHMTSALPYFHRPLAKLLTAMNQNVVKLETASTTTFLERETIAMMHHEFYGSKYSSSFYKHYMHSYDTALGVFTSGGTIANLTAMWVARNRALGPKPEVGFTGVDKEGLFAGLNVYGYKGAVILGSAMLHYSFKKAVDLLGLGDNGLGLVPVNDKFKMKMDALEEKIKEYQAKQFLIVSIIGIAGTTETGSIDDLEAIAQVAQKYKIHFHVDAAWGGPLIFSREHASKLAGVEKADSITIDGHKQLYTPMGLGLLLFSNPGMASSIRKTANYIIRKESADLGQFTLEGSRAAGSLHLHAVLHLLGRDGIESLVTRSATLVRQMAQRLSSHPAHAFQTLHDPETNILLYRYIPSLLRGKVAARAPLSEAEDDLISEATRRIQARQATEGQQGFVSRTKVQVQRSGEKRWVDAFRVVLANPLTKWDDVEGVISEQQTLGVVIENEMVEEKHEGLSSKEKLVMWVGWPFEM